MGWNRRCPSRPGIGDVPLDLDGAACFDGQLLGEDGDAAGVEGVRVVLVVEVDGAAPRRRMNLEGSFRSFIGAADSRADTSRRAGAGALPAAWRRGGEQDSSSFWPWSRWG